MLIIIIEKIIILIDCLIYIYIVPKIFNVLLFTITDCY